jgi:glycerol-3-phosphate dehydrogenase (NAD(P)+)
MKPQAAVLGAGSWGTGLSIALSDSGRDVILYGNEQSVRDDINQNHRNSKYLPDILLPDSIRCSTDIADLCEMPVILLVVPSQVARIVLSQLATVGLPTDSIIVSCTKGIDPTSGKLMHDLIEEFFPENPVAVLSGPSHAEEVAKRMATLATIGSSNEGVAARVQEIFALPWFRTYTSNDVIGIELGGVVKNVFAIAAGAIDGLGLGDNAKAAMVTRGLAEMTRLGIALGAREETIRGLSGLGDLIVTCYSVHSRNNRVGRMLGAGMSLDEAIAQMNQVAEGVPNANLFENKPPADALRELLVRDQRSEAD